MHGDHHGKWKRSLHVSTARGVYLALGLLFLISVRSPFVDGLSFPNLNFLFGRQGGASGDDENGEKENPTNSKKGSFAPPDISYVVQIHSTAASFQREDSLYPFKKHPTSMTTANGKQYNCYLPYSVDENDSNPESEDSEANDNMGENIEGPSSSRNSRASVQQLQQEDLLSFGREAIKKLSQTCLRYDGIQPWIYAVCPSVLMRRVHQSLESTGRISAQGNIMVDLGQYMKDSMEPSFQYNTFLSNDVAQLIPSLDQPLYTQMYGTSNHVQYFCRPGTNVGSGDEAIVAILVQPTPSTTSTSISASATTGTTTTTNTLASASTTEVVKILIASSHFCIPKRKDGKRIEDYMTSLVNNHVCIKKNEGWWTYEFCFGKTVRQFHQEDTSGEVTAQYSLGKFSQATNLQLEQSGKSIAVDFVDGTHDEARPVYVSEYDAGTPCDETGIARTTRVLVYCNTLNDHHFILSIKEVQTCRYLMKVSSPVVCHHPSFLKDASKNKEAFRTIHCVPTHEEGEEEEEEGKKAGGALGGGSGETASKVYPVQESVFE